MRFFIRLLLACHLWMQFHGRLVARALPQGTVLLTPATITPLSTSVLRGGPIDPSPFLDNNDGSKKKMMELPPPRWATAAASDDEHSVLGLNWSNRRAADNNLDDDNMVSFSKLPQKEEEWETCLSIYLYHYDNDGASKNSHSNNDGRKDQQPYPLDWTMRRQPQDLLQTTLKRIGISLGKKLPLPSTTNTKQPQSKSGKSKRSKSSAAAVTAVVGTVKDAEFVPWSPGDTANVNMTNHEFVRRAMGTPLAIQATLPANASSTDNNELAEKTATLNFWVESCPPTILHVRTFGQFDACLFPDVPLVVEVDALFADGVRVDWYVDQNMVHADSFTYTPTDTDVGRSVSILVTPFRRRQDNDSDDDGNHHHHDGSGCELAFAYGKLVQQRPANTVLGLRPSWTKEARSSNNKHLRILTYNILADQNAFDFGGSGQVASCFADYITAEVMAKERRMPLILHEILQHQADLVCLQEVDESIYERLFLPVLGQQGYDGFFAKKISEGNREGCAIFWSTHRFEHVAQADRQVHPLRELFSQCLETTQKVGEWKDLTTIADLLKKRSDLAYTLQEKLGHILITVPLIDKLTGNAIWAANTHLFYHHDASHVRLLQIYMCCWKLSQQLARRNGSIIFCGDFNTSFESSAGGLLRDRSVPENYKRLQYCLNNYQYGCKTDPKPKHDNFPSISLPKSFSALSSSFSKPPIFTNLVGKQEDRFIDVLDHLLVSSSDFLVTESGPMPSVADIEADVAMPNEHCPSDHVSLVCEVKYHGT